MRIPSIQIHQQHARIGIDADLGTLEIRQPKPTLEMQTVPPKLYIEQPKGELRIDSSRAWDALGLGGSLQVMSKIYSMASQIALEGIARIAERGDRLAAIHRGGNPIADIGQEEAFRFREFDFAGEASYDNVDLEYTAHKPRIEVEEGEVRIDTYPNRPEIAYHRGKLDIYMQQYASLAIIPPQIDLTI